MHLRLILAAALAVGLSSAAQAQTARTVATCGAQSLRVGDATNLFVDSTGILCSTAGAGGGGGGATGSVNPAGTNGTSAQAIQGINGGVPVPVTGSFTPAPISGSQEQDVTASRTLDATSTASQQTYTLNGQSTLSFNVSGLTASGATISFFQSNDWNGTTGTFTAVGEVNTGTGIASLTRNTDGQSAIGIEGSKAVRVQVTTAGSGTITLATNISVRSRYLALRAPLPPGTNTIGSIANTGFAVTGTLPSFATTPTFNVGTTNGLALDASVQAVNVKIPAIGTQTKAASRSTTPASDLSNIEPAGTAITGTTMPSGGTGFTGWLSAIWQSLNAGSSYGVEQIAAQAANATTTGTSRDAGASPSSWTRYGVTFLSPATGTGVIETSSDNTNFLTAASVPMTAGTNYDLTVPIRNRYYRAKIINGSTANSGTYVLFSFTKN